MPPFLPRKRLSPSPPTASQQTPAKRARLTDVLDEESTNIPNVGKTKTFTLSSDDSDSSLSDVDSDEFEDVSPSIRLPSAPAQPEDDDEDEDEDVEWEDAGAEHTTETATATHTPLANGPIELIFRKDDTEIDYGTADAAKSGKKGPTKREKEVRVRTHQLHVQFLLWHNAIRNRWISDKEVQKTLLQQLPAQIRKEVDKWRRASGLAAAEPDKKPTDKSKRRGKQKADPRKDRDWGRPSQRLEKGKADMSHGDPLIYLMKVLAAYWKKRFAITAPGLRKRGYGTKQALKQTLYSLRNDEHNDEEHGERIRDLQEFRDLAKKCEGSRDVGAQLFTALLRGLGIEARLVASLQPSGFGWTKAEQILPRSSSKATEFIDTSSDESDLEDSISISAITQGPAQKRLATKTDTDADEDDSVVDVTPSLPKKRPQKYDRDNPFPIYWTEAVSPITNKVLPVSPLILTSQVASTPDILALFEPRGGKAEKTKTVMAYVIAYSPDGSAKDVTVRYLRKRIWPGKTKGFRFPVEKIPIYNKYGKIKRYEEYDWFKRVMSGYVRPDLMRTAVDDVEDASDLVPQEPEKREVKEDVDTLQSLRTSADFVLERFLRREEALRPGAKPDRIFVSGKGDNVKEELVYRRSDVERCLSAESWHKEGRRPKGGEAPLKLVPVRAVTLTRKREAEEHERQTGEKQMQGLYSWDQTEYIIPPPIRNGVIPKNSYGNIDCFVPSMVPKGAVHIPLRGTVRICKKLEIDFAEAVTGFEFGNKRAVPVCEGVVVAKENEKAVIDAWTKFHEEQRKKQETKMEKLVLDLWRKFVMGLRIRERVHDTYGDVVTEDVSALARGITKDQPINLDTDDEAPNAGLPSADDEDGFGGGFLLDDEEPTVPEDLEMVHHDAVSPVQQTFKGKDRAAAAAEYPTPASVSPRKPPVRRQRRSLLEEVEESEISELSSAASDLSGELSDADSDHDGKKVEEHLSSNDYQSEDVEPSASDVDEEDDYKPTTRSSTVKKPAPGQRGRRTRANKLPAKTVAKEEEEDDDDDEEEEDEVITPKTRRSRPKRLLRRDSTFVASPYFEG